MTPPIRGPVGIAAVIQSVRRFVVCGRRVRSPAAIAIAISIAAAGASLTVTQSRAQSPAWRWQERAGHRWAELPAPASASPAAAGFERLPADRTGLRFTNPLSPLAGAANRVLYNGSGVAAGDVDGDGRPDLFFCSLAGSNALYRNLGGWRFEEITVAAGLAEILPETRGAVLADLNADRRLDLLVSVNGRGVQCFLNTGAGRFTNATALAGTASRLGSTTLAVADVDGNGTPDLYVTNYRTDDIRDRGRVSFTMVQGRPILRGSETNRFVILRGKLEETGQPDQLYLNDGQGRFTPVPWTGGAFLDEAGQPLREAPLDWGLAAAFHDVNGDGAPDLYVCNDFWTPDRLWINDGKGRFQAPSRDAWRRMPASSMGVDFADVDLDGDTDFFVVDMLGRDPGTRKRQLMAQNPAVSGLGVPADRQQVPRNNLFLNQGDGTFTEAAYQAGLEASEWSWSPVFLDVDLDGDEDLLVAAGHFRDVQDFDAERQIQSRQRKWDGFPTEAARQAAFTRELAEHHQIYPLLRLPLLGFRNESGARFMEATGAWALDHPGVHQGVALADLDGDGGLDVVLNSLYEGAGVYRLASPGARVMVRLRGRAPNTQAIGARVTLRGGTVPVQEREWTAGGRYLSGGDPCAMFAVMPGVQDMSIEVRWRDGRRTRLEGVASQRIYEIDEEASVPAVTKEPASSNSLPVFEDVTSRLGHVHGEAEYDDFGRQPLLPWKLSRMGPGVAWFDWDGDGADDLLVGSGSGGLAAFLKSDGRGRFAGPESMAGGRVDSTGMAGWVDPSGRRTLLLARSGYEGSLGVTAVVQVGRGSEALGDVAPGMTNASALAIGAPASDGRLALFVGGGVVPGRYPLGAPSRLFRATPEGWTFDARNSVLLENLGIVNGAVWSDLDGDGDGELVLACEWGPVRVFDWRGARLVEITQALGLATFTGWWRSVAAADFDGDGRMDLVAANFGRNGPYRASAERPLVFVHGELAQPGVMEVIETEYAGATLVPRLQMPALVASLPFLHERFPDQKSYSVASVDQVLGDRVVLSRRVQATTLDSMVFLNRGGVFQALPLPPAVQRAPVFGLVVGDFDGDGHSDVFTAQNLNTTRYEIGRLDSGSGCLVLGDGAGGFRALEPAEAGIRLAGEQRGAAAADFDGDGRLDLAVAENGAATRLFRNQGERAGVRVRLTGPRGNPLAYGAQIQGRHGDRWGPVQEIHGGGGYLSQDGAVRVLAQPTPLTAVRVRWPGGRESVVEVPPGAREVNLAAPSSP